MTKIENPLSGPIITEPPEVIRARVVHIKHRVQAHPRQNATHVDLFDQLDLGQLKRKNEGFENIFNFGGGFLCGRSRKDITLYYPEKDDLPTCKKCRKMMRSLLRRGFSFKILGKENWDKARNECDEKVPKIWSEMNKKENNEES